MSGPFRSQDPERSVQRNQTAPNSRPRSAVTLGNRTQRIPQSEISTEVGFLEFVRTPPPVIRRKRGDPPDIEAVPVLPSSRVGSKALADMDCTAGALRLQHTSNRVFILWKIATDHREVEARKNTGIAFPLQEKFE